MLLDESFEEYREGGSLWRTGQFSNLRPVGELSIYTDNNKLLHQYIYPKSGSIVVQKSYTSNGDLEKEVIIEGDPLHGSSYPIRETIFWQKNVGQEPEYLFVSKNGFVIYDRENPVKLDENTPDNIIERVMEDGEQKNYIWKNGQRIPYRYCEEDGYYSSYDLESKTKVEYKWEDCEKIILKEYIVE